ncbi:class II fructose-bisphosphate aldolase [Blochmannia endosymbiont of Camponotus (Colobopsis) obliquus]|uniref:class II fructose-bisphosphate aldolase n=1 Tax=Blochmannia endosymbiont of Camponotus (Colobopsis) obliquus TaxID=1505597 RepID=UPI00061A6C98|nr:class II fructose-bisphosphate aldolase [Blochmannia endosymbiont of Camponotus (Colobopsis) obliquus]AKC60419.1 fructose-bisphosphate aldolase class 2 [Blochmannia endosymbiont of Camponotus (Colobopsis) obliquus]
MVKISNFIHPGVITGDEVQKIFAVAKKNNFALPAINCIGTDSINAVLETAAKVSSPIIVQFSNSGSAFMAGTGLKFQDQTASILGAISGALHVHRVSAYYGVPVILHTDHCVKSKLSWLDGLLDASEKHFAITGKPLFSSHMIDLSAESLEDNLEISAKYLVRMSRLKLTLEIELGSTGGEEDGIDNNYLDQSTLYTHPKDVAYAYEKLSVISPRFIIAASFGNVHGVYKSGNIRLMPEILDHSQKYVTQKFGVPEKFLNLVFHGGSGSTLKDIKRAIGYGVVKINIDTDMQWASWEGVLKYYEKNKLFLHSQLGNPKGIDLPNKKFYDPRIWIRAAQLSMIERLESVFKDLNAINVL